jgi:uncharacterized protein YecT (DUF1311 family)
MRATNRVIVAAAFLFGMSCSCFAQHMNAADAPCLSSASNADETACFVNASKQRDKELNDLYQQVQKVVGGDELVQLKTAERAWMQFRDATCNAEKALYEGGSAQPMVYYSCLEAETRYRIKDLKDSYEWRIVKFR